MARITNAMLNNRADFMTRNTFRTWEYEQGNSYVSYKLVSGNITIRAKTKQELLDASHTFMEGFWAGREA